VVPPGHGDSPSPISVINMTPKVAAKVLRFMKNNINASDIMVVEHALTDNLMHKLIAGSTHVLSYGLTHWWLSSLRQTAGFHPGSRGHYASTFAANAAVQYSGIVPDVISVVSNIYEKALFTLGYPPHPETAQPSVIVPKDESKYLGTYLGTDVYFSGHGAELGLRTSSVKGEAWSDKATKDFYRKVFDISNRPFRKGNTFGPDIVGTTEKQLLDGSTLMNSITSATGGHILVNTHGLSNHWYPIAEIISRTSAGQNQYALSDQVGSSGMLRSEIDMSKLGSDVEIVVPVYDIYQLPDGKIERRLNFEQTWANSRMVKFSSNSLTPNNSEHGPIIPGLSIPDPNSRSGSTLRTVEAYDTIVSLQAHYDPVTHSVVFDKPNIRGTNRVGNQDYTTIYTDRLPQVAMHSTDHGQSDYVIPQYSAEPYDERNGIFDTIQNIIQNSKYKIMPAELRAMQFEKFFHDLLNSNKYLNEGTIINGAYTAAIIKLKSSDPTVALNWNKNTQSGSYVYPGRVIAVGETATMVAQTEAPTIQAKRGPGSRARSIR